MSELKAIFATPHPKMKNACDGAVEVYLKFEADKVIAELKERYFELQDTAIKIDKELTETRKKLRYQKYKRCLAMAWWCSAELGMLVSTWESKIKYYKRWHNRWLELAEKFKEAK